MDRIPKANDEDVTDDTLLMLVRDRCSPELETLYLQLARVLFNCNFTGHLDELDVVYHQLASQNIGPEEVIPSVDEIMRTAVDTALGQIGVEFDIETPLDYLSEAADILLNFDPTDTPTILLDLLRASDDPEDACAKVLSYLGTREEDQWMMYFITVSENFAVTITSVVKKEVDRNEAAVDIEGTPSLLKRLSRLVRAEKDTLGAELGSMNIGLGVSLEHLYGCHVGRLIDLSVENQVKELYSLAAISGASFESAKSEISACLDDLCYESDNRRQAEQFRQRFEEQFQPIFGVGDA